VQVLPERALPMLFAEVGDVELTIDQGDQGIRFCHVSFLRVAVANDPPLYQTRPGPRGEKEFGRTRPAAGSGRGRGYIVRKSGTCGPGPPNGRVRPRPS